MTAILTLTTPIKAALVGLPALNGGKVYRGRDVVLPRDEQRGIRINTVRHAGKTLDVAGTHLLWTGDLAITLMARATSKQDGEEAIDELLGPVWAALLAMPAPPGANGIALDPLIAIALDEADQTVTTATLALRITHITTAADLQPAT